MATLMEHVNYYFQSRNIYELYKTIWYMALDVSLMLGQNGGEKEGEADSPVYLYLSGGSGELFPTAFVPLLSLDHNPLLVPPQTLNLCYCKLLFPDFLFFTAMD